MVQNLEIAGKAFMEMLIAGTSEPARVRELNGYWKVGPEGWIPEPQPGPGGSHAGICTASGDPLKVRVGITVIPENKEWESHLLYQALPSTTLNFKRTS